MVTESIARNQKCELILDLSAKKWSEEDRDFLNGNLEAIDSFV